LTGTSVRVAVPRGATTLEIGEPGGARASWPAAGDVVEVPIARVGFYTAGAETIAANLDDPVESSAAVAPALTLGRAPPPPPARGPSAAPGGRAAAPRSLAAVGGPAPPRLVEGWSPPRRWTV